MPVAEAKLCLSKRSGVSKMQQQQVNLATETEAPMQDSIEIYDGYELIFSRFHRVLGETVSGWRVRKIGGCMTDTFMPRSSASEARAYVDQRLVAA